MSAQAGRHGHRYVIQRLGLTLIGGLILFAAAGTMRWARGWVWVIAALLCEIGTLMALARWAPETLHQRGTRHAGVKAFERLFAVAWLIGALLTPTVAGLDKRFAWSNMPMAALYCGLVLLAISYAFGTWAMVVNEHFEQLVRIQTDRAHRVVTSGPYRIVRHPGYAATMLGAIAMPLILGTWWTAIPAGAMIVLFIVRTALEDRTLRAELEGYAEYASRVRYRLLPGIW